MKKGQIAEGNVTTVEFPNKGIVMTDEGERVIVKNTIPGQRVSFAVNKVRKGKAEGRQEEKHSIALNLKKLGVSIEQIAFATGLSIEEIEKL